METAADFLVELDPQDKRPASQQIASMLRDAIAAGTLSPGDKLPSQHNLASRLGVARETVKAALRILARERLVVTKQGSGAYVGSLTERGTLGGELQDLRAELTTLRDQLQRSNANLRRAEKRISGVLNQLEVHDTREPVSPPTHHEPGVHS
jgi:DNA-binding GntR family transcriptional regulator